MSQPPTSFDLGVTELSFETGLLFALQSALAKTQPGELFSLTATHPSVSEDLDRWARLTENSVISISHEALGTRFVLRNGPAPAREEIPLGSRLWLYTNFDCNLRCDYCCVRSSPEAPRRELGLKTIRAIANEAPALDVAEIFITGGEPTLLPDIFEILECCAEARPTTLLTNGLLLHGKRLERLSALSQERLTLQISLDSLSAEQHDAHRGEGTWEKAMRGIRGAREKGFRVRWAATVSSKEQAAELDKLFQQEDVAEEDRVVRPLARRGIADDGVAVARADLAPEITITQSGVFWHPVGADDRDLLVTTEILPLRKAFEQVKLAFERDRELHDRLLTIFHCA